MDGNVVVIPLERYNELLDAETRINIAVERICHEKFVSKETLLWILGTEVAVETATRIRKEEEEEYEEYLEKHEESEV